MLTKRHFRMWTIVFVVLVVGLLASLPVFADPGIRLGPPDGPATGYAPLNAPAALPATGAQPVTRSWHTVGQIPRLAAQSPSHHTMFELRQAENSHAAQGPQSSVLAWHTVAQIPRVQARPWLNTFELRQAETS